MVAIKKSEIIDWYTIKYHANGQTLWSKGKMLEGKADGYREWYRIDGTIKRSGYFDHGLPTGEWITYDKNWILYKVSKK